MRIDEEQNRRDKNGFWLHVESKVKVKSRQLEIVIWLTNLRPTVYSFYVPLSIKAPLQSYFKLHGKEGSRKKDLRSLMRIEIGTSRAEGHALSNYANPSSTPSCNVKPGDHLMATTASTTTTLFFIIVVISTNIIITLYFRETVVTTSRIIRLKNHLYNNRINNTISEVMLTKYIWPILCFILLYTEKGKSKYWLFFREQNETLLVVFLLQANYILKKITDSKIRTSKRWFLSSLIILVTIHYLVNAIFDCKQSNPPFGE